MAFISLKVTLELTASALTMARRVFSWMTRSRSTADFAAGAGGCRSPGDFFTAAVLATIPPCNHEPEHDVQPPKTRAQERIGDWKRSGNGSHAEEHEPHAHHRNGGDGERPAADERRSITEEPDRPHHVLQPKPIEGQRQHRTGDPRTR